MAIAKMTKVMIASHHSEAPELLEALQQAGIVEILNAEQAMVSKEWPELHVEAQRPKDLEDMVARLEKSITFLQSHATEAGAVSMFSPLVVVEKQQYAEVVSGREALDLLKSAEDVKTEIERLQTEYENTSGSYELLVPWKSLETPVEEIGQLRRTSCIAGLIPHQHFDEIAEKSGELGAAIQQVAATGSMHACLAVCLNEMVGDVQKVLRSGDFEGMSFEGMTGTVASLLENTEEKMTLIGVDLGKAREKASELSKERLSLQILYDHYQNLLDREQKRSTAPATENVILLEGWVKEKDYTKAEDIIKSFSASGIEEMEIAKGEVPPVEIDNHRAVRPFEVITRLYGMPLHFEVDPTIFLAPFFALFFGMCLSDAGYGFLMIAIAIYYLKKSQGDKKFGYMFLICSISTVICGALTGSWFGDAIQLLNIPWLNSFRNLFLRFGFDPSVDPMVFFAVSLIIGYTQLMFGITIALVAKLFRKDVVGAICDHLTWLVMLNALVVYGFSRSGKFLTLEQGEVFLKIAAVPAGTILLFSHREGGIVARLGMGFYNLASSMFYIGDTLSYVRLMALGMVTAGFAGAINQMATMSSGVKFVGPIIAVIVLVALHSFNLGISVLGAFVHSLRLQYVEFFPKFFVGGGKLFEALSRKFKYIYVDDKTEK